MKEAMFYKTGKENEVICELCSKCGSQLAGVWS